MWVDVNLDEPTPFIPVDGPRVDDSAPSNPTAFLRGEPSNHYFSIKRPRRNVAKRSIATLPYTKSALETEEEATTSADSGGHHLYRTPRLTFALLLFVCSAGGIRSVYEQWMSRQVGEVIHADADVTQSFLGLGDTKQWGAVLIGEGPMGNTTMNIEDPTTHYFSEIIVAPEQLSNLVNVLHEPFNPQKKYALPLAHTTIWCDYHHSYCNSLPGFDSGFGDGKVSDERRKQRASDS